MTDRKPREDGIMDPVHRILTGQTLSRKELIVGGIIVVVWFAMDVVQWVDWLIGKFR